MATTTDTPPYFALGAIFPQLSHLHHHLNCFSMSMQLASPAEGCYEHTSLDLLIEQINEDAKNEEYALTR